MEDSFDLPVQYKGNELLFPSCLQQTGYTHRIVVDVYGQEVYYEPDEERRYRAIIDPEKVTKEITVELLGAIAEAIESVLQ